MTIWKVGMLAVCVDDGPIMMPDGSPEVVRGQESWIAALRKGSVYRISRVVRSLRNNGFVALVDDEKRAAGFSDRFRPLNDADDDAELIARIKNCKPQTIKKALGVASKVEAGLSHASGLGASANPDARPSPSAQPLNDASGGDTNIDSLIGALNHEGAK